MNSHSLSSDELKQYIENLWLLALVFSSAVYLTNSIRTICIFLKCTFENHCKYWLYLLTTIKNN